jgi:ferredoxin
VRIESGESGFAPPDPREREQLGARLDAGWRLCCLLVVEADCEVRVLEGSFAYPPEQQRGGPSGTDRA